MTTTLCDWVGWKAGFFRAHPESQRSAVGLQRPDDAYAIYKATEAARGILAMTPSNTAISPIPPRLISC